jgi:hypothetical protein
MKAKLRKSKANNMMGEIINEVGIVIEYRRAVFSAA